MLSVPAAAQVTRPPEDLRLLLSDGTLRGSPRLMGLAGAFVGIAEGAEGITRNPASAAYRDPHYEDFNVDFGGTMHFLFPGSAKEQDWNNDGRPDQVEGPLGFLGSQVLYTTVSLQYKSFALAAGLDTQNFITKFAHPGFETFYNLNLMHVSVSASVALWRDQLLFGMGINTTHALLFHLRQAAGMPLPAFDESMGYHGWGVEFGGLWRPEGDNYRVGFSFRPKVQAYSAGPVPMKFGGDKTDPADDTFLVPPRQVVTPARLSLGASFAFGEGGRDYNIGGPSGWVETGETEEDGTPKYSFSMTKWLLTAQLDIFFPVDAAISPAAFLDQSQTQYEIAGDQAQFLLRLASEKEVIEDRLRLRLGTYFEPPITPQGLKVRPHICFGGEVKLFEIGSFRLAFGLSFDFAHRYNNLSIALMAWK